MNPTVLFFLIGFAAALVGFLSGFVLHHGGRRALRYLYAVRLRRYAERVSQCWEGADADADAVVSTMLRAADLLDGDR